MSEPQDASKSQQDVGPSHLVLAQLQTEIRELRAYVSAMEANIRNVTLLGALRRVFARASGSRLHKLDQYRSRHVHIPASYHRATPPANPPLISIVTPSYNQGRFLEETIKSVLDQNYPRLEYAIQDGGSKDESAALIEKYRSKLVHGESRRDKGQGNAINLGFAHACKGEIMAYLNSDDLLMPGSLNYVASYFAAHPEVDVVYGHRIIVDHHSQEVGRWVLPAHSERMLLWADYVPQETLFWRRRVWDKAGGKIDESFQFALDWDLLLRLRDVGARFQRLPRFLGAFRIHPTQKTSAELASTGTPEMNRIRERLHGRTVTLVDIRKNMRGYMLAHAWHNWLYRLGIANQ